MREDLIELTKDSSNNMDVIIESLLILILLIVLIVFI